MLSCPRCGAPCQPHHKFCGSCAAPIQAAAPGAFGGAPPIPPPPAGHGGGIPSSTEAGFGSFGSFPKTPSHGVPKVTPPPPLEFDAPMAQEPPRAAPPSAPRSGAACQLGHEIAPGYSYCPMGHPLALDAVRVAGADQFSPGVAAPTPYAPPVSATPYAPAVAPTPPPQGYPSTGPVPPFATSPRPSANGGAASYGAGPVPSAPPATAPMPPTVGKRGERRQLAGFLVSFHKDPLGSFFPLYVGANQVGRAGAANDLDIAITDPATSSNHATIHADTAAGRFAIEDLGSTNGTMVNEERVAFQGRRDLRDGDRIRFGSFTAKLMLVQRA